MKKIKEIFEKISSSENSVVLCESSVSSVLRKFLPQRRRSFHRERQRKSARSSHFLLASTLLFGWLGFACQPNQQIVNSGQKSPTPVSTAETKKLSVEQAIRDMQTVDFDYIFVVRRRDSGVFDGEDRKYLRQNTPLETNRFVAADDDKAFVIGSAFRFPPESIEALKQRFNFEDFSKPETKAESNSAANQANKSQNANPTNRPTENRNQKK